MFDESVCLAAKSLVAVAKTATWNRSGLDPLMAQPHDSPGRPADHPHGLAAH
ncbi:hypothetical protein [Prauserella sp. PE36]|uniref:hypothetical protein n=1 Tax=Prauserella sp. PE36 TaxID=1504709 RepID=UPI001314C3F1|nr:hypothetical protein [Prauserella sp. PE36]